MFQEVGGIKPSHSSEDVEKPVSGVGLPVPRLPEVEDGLCRTGSGGEERDISVDIEPLGQHPPVIAERDRSVQHPGERLLGLTGQSEGHVTAVGLVTGAPAGAGPHLVLPAPGAGTA